MTVGTRAASDMHHATTVHVVVPLSIVSDHTMFEEFSIYTIYSITTTVQVLI